MTETSKPWQDGAGDGGPYSANAWRDIINTLGLADGANVGVVSGILNELAVTSTGDNNITVNTGRAIVDGTLYENDASESKTSNDPSVGTTGRRVVLQKNWTARTVRIVIISSADGTAALPALTQTDGVTWEIPLASFTITTAGVIGALTDERYFASPFVRRKASIETVNNSAAMQDDDDFYFYAEANAIYLIELHCRVSFPIASDFDCAFTVPSGAAISGWHSADAGTGTSVSHTANRTADWTAEMSVASSVGVLRVYDGYAILVMGGTAGKVQYQWAQAAAVAEDTSLEAGSFMSVRRIN